MDGDPLYGFRAPCQMRWLKNVQKKFPPIYKYEEELVFYSLCRYMLKKNDGVDDNKKRLKIDLKPI